MDDLEDVPRELKRKMTFVPVSHMGEVLDAALEAGGRSRRPRRRTRGTPSASAQARRRR
jgi:ATP-dependent Lon protease